MDHKGGARRRRAWLLYTCAAMSVGAGLYFAVPAITQTLKAPGDKVDCRFTEPFMTVSMDFSSGVMVIESIGDLPGNIVTERSDTLRELQSRDIGPQNIGVFFSQNSKTEPVMLLQVSVADKGSDGMSDHVYQSTGFLRFEGDQAPQMGGCDFVL